MGCVLVLLLTHQIMAQTAGTIKYLRVGSLNSYFGSRGTEPEGGKGSTDNGDDQEWWPAEYGDCLANLWGRGMSIGTKNFQDPVLGSNFAYKVVCVGPRDNPAQAGMFFPSTHRLIGKFAHPLVLVDNAPGSEMDYEDLLDEIRPDLNADRMIETVIHSSIGLTVTRRIKSFSNHLYSNIFFYEYVLTNTGIIDDEGGTYPQDLKDVILHFQSRYAPAGGEPVPGYDQGWGIWNTLWGESTVNQTLNAGTSNPCMQYCWYGGHSNRNVPDDWGCPDELETGVLGGVQYIGYVTLHVDKSASDNSNDKMQPMTTAILNADDDDVNLYYNQYDADNMRIKYQAFTQGHMEQTHADYIIQNGILANNYPNIGGGYETCSGFGPWDIAVGDSVKVVYAEAVDGINRSLARSVGRNWLLWYNGEATPTLTKPDGSDAGSDYNAYKREWVKTGEDSLLRTFNRAVEVYDNGMQIASPPVPPSQFYVNSGGDRIALSWSHESEADPHFTGYIIYRSEGNVQQPETVYKKIFPNDTISAPGTAPDGSGMNYFADQSALRGKNYYYYVQAKDDGSQAGVTLTSSLFWTLTSAPATLQRPAVIDSLEAIRIVPNPYDIRSRVFQYGVKDSFDRIAFLNLPPVCTIRIFTERGDLIWTKEHTNYTGDELWDSLTSSGQIVVSGIYLVHFETPEGGSIIRKMIIIR